MESLELTNREPQDPSEDEPIQVPPQSADESERIGDPSDAEGEPGPQQSQ